MLCRFEIRRPLFSNRLISFYKKIHHTAFDLITMKNSASISNSTSQQPQVDDSLLTLLSHQNAVVSLNGTTYSPHGDSPRPIDRRRLLLAVLDSAMLIINDMNEDRATCSTLHRYANHYSWGGSGHSSQ